MIGSLRGALLDRRSDEVLVEVAGVGYRVITSPTTAVALGDVGDDVFVWVHHHVREDAEALYGFATREERLSFEALLGAHGVGPSLALAILSVHAPEALARILFEDDVAALCLVPGVGKKTAARLLIELKSRFDDLDIDLVVSGGTTGGNGAGSDAPGDAREANARDDVRVALAELGYGPDEIRAATADLPSDGDTGELLRSALAGLASGRPTAR
jgi:Holliday junction DNA helicase RuvA